MEITTNEKELLNIIAHDEYSPLNGETPEKIEDCTTWVDVYSWGSQMNMTKNQVKGVLSSMVKKELIDIYEDGGDTAVSFLPKGWEEFKKL